MANTLRSSTPDLGVRVLSLDGGAGALSELLILERLMYRVKTEGNLQTMPSPYECFELIGGSGTGGIIALMLGRLRMSVPEAKSAYEKLCPESKIGFGDQFQASKFEEDLKQIFKEEYMSDSRVDACKTFVCAMNAMNMNAAIPELFRSYDTREEPASECLIWEAARATSAMPGLFKPMEIGSGATRQRYIDGGLGHNNPTTLVVEEARHQFPSRPVVLVISLGSGHPDMIQMTGSPSPDTLKKIATDCERTHEDNTRRFRVLPGTYFRFNVQQGLQRLEPHQWEESSEVVAHTKTYLKLEDTKAKLTDAVKVVLNPVIPVSESAVYVKVCPLPTVRFTGRGDILMTMSQYFNTDLGQRHIFLLHGLGGAGKSQIAFKFIDQSKARFSEVYFVDSSSKQTIENDLATIALSKKLGKDPEVTLSWLAHQTTEWLILFNNADDINLNLARYFPTGPHGSILITSRNPDLGQHTYLEHKVDRMHREEAIDLLLSAARHDVSFPENRQLGKQLVERLHCLPLAVAQAGAYISSSRALARYLELYESTAKRIRLLNQRPPQSDYEWSVYTTWQISFEKLSSQAAELLQLCSFIHYDGITEEIFQHAASYKPEENGPTETELHEPWEFLARFQDTLASKWDSMKFMPLTDELGRYSLIEFQATPRYITFSIHPLVHEWSRTSVKSEANLEGCMHRLLGMSISSPTANFRFSHQKSADHHFQHHIFPHLDALSFVDTSGSSRQPNVVDTAFAHQYLWAYYDEGKYSDGVELGNQMLLVSSAGQNDLRTVRIKKALAVLYAQNGMLHQAQELEELVMTRMTEILGGSHKETLGAMADLAVTYSQLGGFQRAKELETQVLEKRTKILGEDHPHTLITMGNLANKYSYLGQFQRAKELQTQALKKLTKILGEDHPATVASMHNLANRYLVLGEFQRANELQTLALEKRIKIFGEDHPKTLMTMGNLARICSELGNLQRAKELQTTVLEKQTEILGEDHPDTLSSMNKLAVTSSGLGDINGAQRLQTTTLKKQTDILGMNHPHTMNTMDDLAETYYQLGKWDDAEHLLLASVIRRSRTDHNKRDILVWLGILGKVYCSKGHLEQAAIFQETSSDDLARIFSPNHPDVLTVRLYLSATYRAQGRLEEAQRLGAEVVRRMVASDSLGKDHPSTLLAQTELVTIYHLLGRFEDTEKLGVEVLEQQKSHPSLGNDHPQTLRSLASLGRTYYKMGRLSEARELQDQALTGRRKVLGLRHPDTEETENELAETIAQLGRRGRD